MFGTPIQQVPAIILRVPMSGSDFRALQCQGGATTPEPNSPEQQANLLIFVQITKWQFALFQAQHGITPTYPITPPASYRRKEPGPPWLAMEISVTAVQYAILTIAAGGDDKVKIAEIIGGILRDGVANFKQLMREIGRSV